MTAAGGGAEVPLLSFSFNFGFLGSFSLIPFDSSLDLFLEPDVLILLSSAIIKA